MRVSVMSFPIMVLFVLFLLVVAWLTMKLVYRRLPDIDPRYGFLFGALLAAMFVPGLDKVAFIALTGMVGYLFLTWHQKKLPPPMPHPTHNLGVHRPEPPRRLVDRPAPRRVSPIELEPADRPAPQEGGPIAGVLRALVMFVLFAAGGGLFAMIGRNDNLWPIVEESIELSDPRAGRTIDSKTAKVFGPNDPIDAVPIGQTVLFESDARYNQHDAVKELAPRIRQFLTLALKSHFADHRIDVDEWEPSWSWIRRDLISKQGVKPAPDDPNMRSVQLGFDLSPERLAQILTRFRADQSWDRTVGLAKGYGGTILILGGLSIFLRLGTGRKASTPT